MAEAKVSSEGSLDLVYQQDKPDRDRKKPANGMLIPSLRAGQ
jgi:hypothetical protein